MDYEMIHLSGAWARERYVKTRKLEMGTQAVQSLAGTGSSSEQNPFIALKRPHTTEDTGEDSALCTAATSLHRSRFPPTR